MRLSVKRIAKLTAPGRYPDGDGLYLRVKPSGAKHWLYRYELNGKERFMGLGGLKTVTLDEARDLAEAAMKQARAGIDPIDARKDERTKKAADAAAEKAMNKTFEECAIEYNEGHQHQWSNDHHRKRFLSSLRMHAFGKIGKLPVGKIDTAQVLRVIDPIWKEMPDTANRIRQRIENILDWATVRGLRTGDNPARWKGHLSEALPPRAAVVTKHHEAMPYSEVPAFVAKLPEQRGIAPKAMEFLILTAARSNEVIDARWHEIDLERKLWIIPASRMKEKREHRVPLQDRAIAILKELPREGEYVFIGARKGQPLGKNSFLKLLWAMGHKGITTHGFRSSFRDWAGETTNFSPEIAEVALSHVVGGAVQMAYQRGDLLEKRRELMLAWENFLTGRTATVTSITGKKRRGA